MDLSNLQPSHGSTHSKKRIGRGHGSGLGKTSGKGHKGQKARSGGSIKPGFEGGQMPMQRRLPKLKGFKNRNKVVYAVVNVERLAEFDAGSTITPDDLRARGLAKKRGPIKILGEGEIDRALTVHAHSFSLGAVEKIKAAGGSVEVVN